MATNASTARALERLTRQLHAGEELAAAGAADEGAVSSWWSETRHVVEESFGENSTQVTEFVLAGDGPPTISSFMGPEDVRQLRAERLSSQLQRLRTFVDALSTRLHETVTD